MNTPISIFNISRHEGSALIVGLILLLCLTILGVAGMNMSRIELLITQNSQFVALSKATAEGQIDIILNPSATALNQELSNQALDTLLDDVAEGTWNLRSNGAGSIPTGGYSKQGGKFAARFYEFETAISEYAIDTDVTVVQGAFIITPGE